MGRLDHLVEAVYERFKDRYYPDESAFLVFVVFVVYEHEHGCLLQGYILIYKATSKRSFPSPYF